MIIRINDKNGNYIGECDLYNEEFPDILDIDIDVIRKKDLEKIKTMAKKWSRFETIRNMGEELSTSDDMELVLDLIKIPLIHKWISKKEYNDILSKVHEFFKYDGTFVYQDNYEDYNELDEFIENLNPIFKK